MSLTFHLKGGRIKRTKRKKNVTRESINLFNGKGKLLCSGEEKRLEKMDLFRSTRKKRFCHKNKKVKKTTSQMCEMAPSLRNKGFATFANTNILFFSLSCGFHFWAAHFVFSL